MEVLDRGWRRIVSELGVEFLLPEAVEILRAAGQIVEEENRVRFDPEFILEQVAKVPREFDLAARNPERSAHIGGDHMVFRARLRLSVHPRGRGAARREDGRLRESRAAGADLRRARLAGRHDLRARGPPARLAPPRHGLRAADAERQALHGLGHLGRQRGRHDRDGRDPVRRARGDRGRARLDLADQRQLAAALRRPHAGGDVRVRPRRPAGRGHAVPADGGDVAGVAAGHARAADGRGAGRDRA